MKLIERTVEVRLETGLQANTAAQFVQKANRFSANVFLEKGTKRINAKSIMGLMSLVIMKGDEVTLYVEGEEDEIASETLVGLLGKSIL